MDSSLEELIKAFDLIHQSTAPPLEYRLYYNSHGQIYQCSMQNHDQEGDYLIVNKEEYDRYFDYEVRDRALVLIDKNPCLGIQFFRQYIDRKTIAGQAALVLETPEEIETYACKI